MTSQTTSAAAVLPHPDAPTIRVEGARAHNLKDVSVTIPRDAMVVFTGLSGSGKSSLAFDTIFAEGQRRYVESLSSYARMFLGQVDKPDVDLIEGLSPAVSIDQKSTSKNPRSTVGTITEVHDFLRLLWARVGVPHCPTCGERIEKQTTQQIVDSLLQLPERTRIAVLAPLVRERKGEFKDLFSSLLSQGYSRAVVDGEQIRLDDPPVLKKQYKHSISVVVDRIVIRSGVHQRLTDSVETGLAAAEGRIDVELVDDGTVRTFSENLRCPNDHPLVLDEIEPRTFSFNSPFGACPECDGIGTRLSVDESLVVPDDDLSLTEGAIAPWSAGKNVSQYFLRIIAGLADELGFDLTTPWKDLSAPVRKALLEGKDYKVQVKFKNRFGRERTYSTGFEGVYQYILRKHEETESDSSRERYEAYMREVPCPVCHGARLRPEVLAVTVGGRSIAEVSSLPIDEAAEFLTGLELSSRDAQVAAQVMKEITARLQFLLDVGLDYLSLDRTAGTLSGGEAQRIRLATQIGSGLVGVLYVLDEPSIGLHQRDNRRLIETLLKLRNLGNTLIVVEHDEETIEAGDWIVDIGPRAGEHGGEIVYSGPVAGLTDEQKSLTGDYLAGRRRIPLPAARRPLDRERTLTVVRANENNLRDLTVDFPLGVLTVVSGVSGSGKSTLVNDILYTELANKLNNAKRVPGRHKSVKGLEHLDKVIHVDQSPIGRTPRSNPATYTGVFDHIRRLFSETEVARIRGYQPGRFSFNVKGGRCENCKGDGTIRIEMNFLPDVFVPCEVCGGARYNRETLDARFKGKSIAEVLNMPIEEAAEFFEAVPAISRHLRTLNEVGLGYVRLGQPATTLSGGEAQRVKLAAELQKRTRGRTVYVLDEPTTGLHFEDISRLLGVLQGLVDKGNSVIVIEHNVDVIAAADHIIDMGPEGGRGGGQVIAQGTPEEVARVESSHTGRYLAELLERRAAGGSE
ncbi:MULTISPECIES: excinuclease ABC subunit UvrA [Brevibacterium]|uniref:UvrABC system protein A n=1 Tax=Brevibacterium salitolerans TaxID=1403566 RepID=A0ABN2WG56_9MICO|nr:excinuclease ABC subunit UvrA [Brevibacterium sp.]